MFSILGADGKEYGPVAADKVREWIIGGRANLQTKARRVEETDWKTLGEFPEFAAASSASAHPPAVPTMAPGGTQDALASGGEVLAGRWERLGAVLIDSILGCLVAAPGFGMMMAAGFFSHPDSPNVVLLGAGVGLLCLAALAFLIFQIYLLVTRGQTLGKKWLGIKIVTFETEENPGFVKTILLRVVVNGLIGAVPVIGGIYSLVDALFIFRDDRRCIHDFIAGTKVVVA